LSLSGGEEADEALNVLARRYPDLKFLDGER
jgi:hypothetical protein